MNSFSKNIRITSLFLHFFLFLLINITQCPLACHEQERRALLDFKFSLEDPANRLSSWLDDNKYRNCCHWHGVGCSSDSSHVVSINLRNIVLENFYNEILIDPYLSAVPPPNTALQGKFSSSFVNISHLEYVDLAFNNFEESKIPFLFSALTKLVHLDLSLSNFSAPVSTPLTNLSSLRYLDLSCGSIDGDIHSISAASCLELSSIKWLRGSVNLKVLRLRGIDLHEAASSEKNFAESISYLSNLRILDLSHCGLSSTDFPTHEFFNLSRLSSLTLSENPDLKFHIPVQLVNLTSLSILDLSFCGLQGSVPYLPQLTKLNVRFNPNLPLDLTRMFQQKWPKLQRLSISDTNASGSIPDSISNAPLLVNLYAFACRFEGSLPSSISNLKFLRTLDLSYNVLQGSIPKSICEMYSLRELRLHNNNITGFIPSCLTNLKNLTAFTVNGNSIEGTVSLISFINDLNLKVLDLSSNRLTVVIDRRFHLYSKFKLEVLNLQSCNLQGLFPTLFLCKLSNLMYLDLSHNHLTGVIPTCFSKLNFNTFNLSNNKLHGRLPLPPQAFDLFGVYPSSFDVSYNKINGEISTDYGKRLSSFYSINLAGNALSSSIPFSICSRNSESNPEYINLSNNKFFGVIPTSIGYSRNLLSLNLGNNNLTGNVPNELQQLESLSYLQLNDNILDGTPLSFISKLQELRVLNLANNHFEGSIPSAFGSAIRLRILSLRSNKFNGSIPQEISQLEKLQILDSSGNNLNGLIPRKIGNLMMLRSRPNFTSLLADSRGVQLQMVIKGIMIQFEKLYIFSGIDLSCNNLEGNIPEEIGLLKGLSTLNLSHNRFSSVIPQSVGSMNGLESLDLSFNRLIGLIPNSLASMSSLERLNLSYNNLSGKIPREPHFDTLSGDGSAYLNNSLLCGFYTNNTCEADRKTDAADGNSPNEGHEDDKEDAKDKLLLYAIVALGFAVGFWGLFFVLLLKKQKWWFPYWRLVDVVAVGVTN
ncbi:hypothetical protein MKW92_049616 [Papaver armeniacum]|nr:hypothetical protein MKW92_049616 [Papaver armeniacum]